MTTPEDTELREMLELNAETIETDDGKYLAVDIDRAMNLITLHTQKAEIKAEIKGKVAAYNQMIMGAGEYHDDPYGYVVPIEHIKNYRAGLMKFDLASSNPIYREKA